MLIGSMNDFVVIVLLVLLWVNNGTNVTSCFKGDTGLELAVLNCLMRTCQVGIFAAKARG